jgi:hypothetical protein
MLTPLCPNCRSSIIKVKLVTIPADPDVTGWTGPVPEAMGFVCPKCDVLLPLSPMGTPPKVS